MSDLTPNEILAQLKTRGFEDGFSQTPLRRFRARLTNIGGSMVQRGQMQESRLEVIYSFAEIEVIESTETFIAPVTDLAIMHSNRKRSGMGYLGASIDAIVNAGLPADAPMDQVKGQDFLIGKMQEWAFTPGHMIWDGNAREERPRDCWTVVWVEGISPAPAATSAPATTTTATLPAPVATAMSSTQQALTLLNGKTEAQWHQVVFNDDVVKADANLVNSLIARTFLTPLETAGIVTKDANGVYAVDLSKLTT